MEVCLAKAGAPVSGLDISEQQLLDCANHVYGADFMCNRCNRVYGHVLRVWQLYIGMCNKLLFHVRDVIKNVTSILRCNILIM